MLFIPTPPLKVLHNTYKPHPLFFPQRPYCSSSSAPPQQYSSPPVPRSVPEVITLASASLDTVLSSPSPPRRLRLTAQVPGLDPNLENTYPYNEALLFSLILKIIAATPSLSQTPVRLLFASSGTAAAARKVYEGEAGGVPENVVLGSFAKREWQRDESRIVTMKVGEKIGAVNVVVGAKDRRGDKVWMELRKMMEEEKDGGTWILVNEELGKEGIIGMKERTAVTKFLKSFIDCFYFRGLYIIRRPQLVPEELGALVLTEMGRWRVVKLVGNRYELLTEFSEPPNRQQLEDLTDQLRYKPTMRKRSQPEESAGDTQFLVMLLGLSVVTSALLWYFRVYQSGTLGLN